MKVQNLCMCILNLFYCNIDTGTFVTFHILKVIAVIRMGDYPAALIVCGWDKKVWNSESYFKIIAYITSVPQQYCLSLSAV